MLPTNGSCTTTWQVSTFALLPQIVREVRCPVIAAGGIADAKGVVAAMKLDAAGVQIGTAYLLCPEATTSPVHRAALKSDGAPCGINESFHRAPCSWNCEPSDEGAWHDQFPCTCFSVRDRWHCTLRAKAESQGSGDFSPLRAGQNVSGCKEIAASELTRQLAAELY